ncbi:hypothetical protein D9X30_1075 [Cupriavidus sp. U2]|uniref:recombinase family protein n=1 Tax=Cupriavidus sp. U2 TaxID=2920269 RepID=UPI001892B69C|nr:recombinase family protein [Cupriavidus sp. U2]KAI3593900.1 hypothetical protein D9X30_1075 [Cupriavidus sp. U2]
MTPKAYSYIRFSSPEQARGHSKQRQIDACDAYCAKHGLALAREQEYSFFDEGKSGFKGDHVGSNGQLARFLSMVEQGKIKKGSYLIVESLDRLSREHVMTALPRFIDLLNAGINVVTLADDRAYVSGKVNEMEIMYSLMIMGRAHEESTTKQMRVGAAWRAKQDKAREGIAVAKTLPSWISYKDGEYQIIPDRAATVRRIFDLALDGYGKGRIAMMLNAEGIPSFKAGLGKFSGTWGTSSIDKVLSNKAVFGVYQPKSRNGGEGKLEATGDAVENYFPVVVPANTYYAARDAIEARRTTRATKQSDNFNVWQGIARCALCGAALHMTDKGRPPKGSKYLSCANKRKGTCSASLIRLDQSEQLLPLILARLDSMALVKDSGGKLTKDLAEIDGRISEQQAKLDKAVKAFESEPSPDIAASVRRMRDAINELGSQREHVQGELAAEDAIGFDTFMQRLDLASRNGRHRANSLLKRLGVQVFGAGPRAMVAQDGYLRFGVAYFDGKAGYLELSAWKSQRQSPDDPVHVAALKALKAINTIHYIPPSQAGAGAYGQEEDGDQARQDALEDEGQRLQPGEY